MKECILTVKKRGHRALGEELASAAAEMLVAAVPRQSEVAAVLAVPPSQQGQKFRGFSLPQLMEERLCALTGWPSLPPEQRRVFRSLARSSQGMTRDDRLARQREVSEVEESNVPLVGTLLLLDDVVTTGATLSRCILQAEKQGYREILCVALAEQRPEDNSEPN